MRDSIRYVLNQVKSNMFDFKTFLSSTDGKTEIKAYINENFKNRWINLFLKWVTNYITRKKI